MSATQTNMNIHTKHTIAANKHVKDSWFGNLELTKRYIVQNSKRPSRMSDESAEKMMGRWMTKQQTDFKRTQSTMIIREIRTAWRSFVRDHRYMDYISSDEEMWLRNLEILKKYINENSALPDKNSVDQFEKMMGRWMTKQLTDWKKSRGMLRGPVLSTVWNDFEEADPYYQYFIERRTHELVLKLVRQ